MSTCDYCSRHPKSSFDYVRHYYGVPARRGMRVSASGQPGVITSGDGGYIRIRLDGETSSGRYHPTWEIVYHTDEGDVSYHADQQHRPDDLQYVPIHQIFAQDPSKAAALTPAQTRR